MENDIIAGPSQKDPARRNLDRTDGDRPQEYFSLRLTLSGAAQEFDDPRRAGEAFFRADPAERPTVAHIDGNSARTMTRTEIHGVHETGEVRYFKSLPDGHAPDAAFRAGFLNAMEASLAERLSSVGRGKDGPALTRGLDTGLKDDLEAFARSEPQRAADLWAGQTTEAAPGPVLQAALQIRETGTYEELQPHSGAPVNAPDRTPSGLVLEHRGQPELPSPETAIYASADAQLLLTLVHDNEDTRDLAKQLVADPAFRKLVAEHIPDADETLGPGRFVDGQGSGGFLPEELLVVSSYSRDGHAEILAKFPDERPISEALARHLAQSPVMAAYADTERQRNEYAAGPDELRAGIQGIASATATRTGPDRQKESLDAPPRSTLYSTSIKPTSLVVGGSEAQIEDVQSDSLHLALRLRAGFVGIEAGKLDKRLQTGAANAREEESWVKSDIADVARHHGFNPDSAQGRSFAAGQVDRFYERAAELIRTAHGITVARGPDPLVEALDSLAQVRASQGSVAFRTEEQARDFAEGMAERYGASVLQDIAAGRTGALAKDVPDPVTRKAVALAVISAAKEHPSLGLSAHEAEAAERRMAADTAPRPPEHNRAHRHDRNQDREF